MSTAARAPGERGFALLLVLWTLPVLALLVAGLAAAGRREALIARNLRNAAMLEAAAEGALHEAAFRLLDPSERGWKADGATRRLPLPQIGGIAEIRIENLAGRVNPNTASAELLQAVLGQLGMEPNAAASLAARILDWRRPGGAPRPEGTTIPEHRTGSHDHGPPGTPFESLDELGAVPGMTPELLARLRPLLSVHQEGPTDPSLAHPLVARALAELGQDGPQPSGDEHRLVVAITVNAIGPEGSRLLRRAVLRIGGSRGRAWRILAWDALPEG